MPIFLGSFLIPKVSIIENKVNLNNSTLKIKVPAFLELIEEKEKIFISQKKDFLKVDLDRMEITLHKGGEVTKEVPILRKGDPQRWGGSAVGLYKIMSGNEISYSTISKVYMPYSLRYYGKYYIHGEPYYPGGTKLESSVSGGCLRLKDEDAESIYELTEINMPVLVMDKEKDYYEYPKKNLSDFPQISAKSYLVADLDSGFIFSQKSSQEKLPVASLTKLMTAVVVSENIDLRKSISITEPMLEGYGSTDGLEKGKYFSTVELFYPLLIESSNDAAEALSYFLGRDNTIRLMNEKAKSIFMEQTKFVDPSGYDPENISTAQDLFYLARYILNNRPPLLEITKGKEVLSFGGVSFDIEKLWNKNVFIEDPTLIGGKTGFIKKSKNTAIFIFRLITKDDLERNIAIILLGSDNNKTDTQKVYMWLLKNHFKMSKELLEGNETVEEN